MSEARRRRRPEPAQVDQAPLPDSPAPAYDDAYEAPPREESRHTSPQYAPPAADNRTIIVNQVNVPAAEYGRESYFDGGLLSWIGWSILAVLLTMFTFGLGYPFAACMLYRWEARHTIINGRHLHFDGTGWQLIGKWIIWMLLTLITLGIYGFWLAIKLKQWRVKHTHFA